MSPLTPQMIQMIGSAGPGGARSPNPGLRIAAMSKLREAIHLIQTALPDLDIGDDAHKAAMSAINGLSKVVGPDTQEDHGVSQATLMGLMNKGQQLGPLMGMGGGGAGSAPPTPPPPSMPGAPG